MVRLSEGPGSMKYSGVTACAFPSSARDLPHAAVGVHPEVVAQIVEQRLFRCRNRTDEDAVDEDAEVERLSLDTESVERVLAGARNASF
jgi:hypothetical protein